MSITENGKNFRSEVADFDCGNNGRFEGNRLLHVAGLIREAFREEVTCDQGLE